MMAFIDTSAELYDYFNHLSKSEIAHHGKLLKEGVFVSSKIQRDVLLNEQGKIVIDGRIRMIKFEKAGSGVYKATLVE